MQNRKAKRQIAFKSAEKYVKEYRQVRQYLKFGDAVPP